MEPLKRECGVALARALRGQEHYMLRVRALGITEVFQAVQSPWRYVPSDTLADATSVTTSLPFVRTIHLGHLRYCITGKSGLSFAPLSRRHNARPDGAWMQNPILTDYYETKYTKRQ